MEDYDFLLKALKVQRFLERRRDQHATRSRVLTSCSYTKKAEIDRMIELGYLNQQEKLSVSPHRISKVKRLTVGSKDALVDLGGEG